MSETTKEEHYQKEEKNKQIIDSDDSDNDSDKDSELNEEPSEDDKPKERQRPSLRENVFYYKVKLYSNRGNNPNKIFQQLL